MSKFFIIAAAASALVIATPAFAQDRGKPAGSQSTGFGGRNGSATTLRDAPRRGAAGPKVKVFDGNNAGATGQSRGFGGRNGSATDLRDAPRPGRTDARPARMKSSNNLKQVGLANH